MRPSCSPLLAVALVAAALGPAACSEYDLAGKPDLPDDAQYDAGGDDPGVDTGASDDGGGDPERAFPGREPSETPIEGWPGDDTGGGGGDTGTPWDGEDADDFCDKASRVTGYLDTFQVPDDGRVVFCHRQGGPHFTAIDTSISACMPHLDHTYDVFPSTLCDS